MVNSSSLLYIIIKWNKNTDLLYMYIYLEYFIAFMYIFESFNIVYVMCGLF